MRRLNLIKAGLILEGGAKRGIFTAGVLDYLMEQDVWLEYAVGVSAGSCNLVDYISGQKERTKNCFLPKYKYAKWDEMLKKKTVIDMDLLFDKYPNEIYPFDFETYRASKIKADVVVTNCLTGKAEYMDDRTDKKRMFQIVRASSSMPLVSPMVTIDNIPYLDGGLADSIPLRRSVQMGYKKHVLILTRRKGYRKKVSYTMDPIYHLMYREYPELRKTIAQRPIKYNRMMDTIERLEEQGKIFVIRPRLPEVSRLEGDYDALIHFYRHGYREAEKKFEHLMNYLKN